MSFVGLPLAVAIAIAVVAVAAVVTLYLLKSTPKPQPVSNIEFWMRAVEQAKPAWIFSLRIPLVALLLTLLAALLLIAVAADPRLHDVPAQTTVVVIDAGATMEAGSFGSRRIDAARERLETVAAESTRNGQVALIRAGVEPSVLVPLTRNAHDITLAASSLTPDQGPSSLDAAITLADLILSRRPSGDIARVVVISDRYPASPSLRGTLVFHPVGVEGQTVGIVAFGARRDPTALGEYGVHCEVQAFTKSPVKARLVIRDRDVVLAEEELELEPGERVTHEARGFASDASEVTARLIEIDVTDGEDAFAPDDSAAAVVEPLARTRVLIVTRGNRFLEQVVRVNPAVEAERVTPEEFVRSGGSGYDVVVLDSHVPDQRTLAHHPGLLMIGPTERREGLSRLGPGVTNADITSALTSHPVLDAVELDDVTIRRGTSLLPEPEDRALFRSERHVLATARDTNGARRVVLGFQLNQTDLVERPAFPLLMHNAIIWLANQQTLARSSRYPGQPLSFGGRRAEIELPSGEQAEGRNGAYFDTGQAGVYRIGDRPYAFSSVDFNGPLRASSVRAPTDTFSAEPPLTLILALILLALLATEWVLFHRGRV